MSAMWPAYLINLAANTHRLQAAAAQLDGAGVTWERIEAVNGWGLTQKDIASVYDAKRNARSARHRLVAPEIGCYLSHIAAWEEIAAGPAPGGFVFEDDFSADASLAETLRRLSAPQEMWDMVKLFSFSPVPRLRHAEPFGRARIGIPDRVPTCMIGYALTKPAAARLAAHAVPFFRPVDEDQKFVWETGLRVALVVPPPLSVGDEAAETGTVGAARRAGKKDRSGLGQIWRNIRYQTQYTIAARRHRNGQSQR